MYRVVTPETPATAAELDAYYRLRWEALLCQPFHLPVGANSRIALCIG